MGGEGLGWVGAFWTAGAGGAASGFAAVSPSEGVAPTPGGRVRNSCKPSFTSWLVPIAIATDTQTIVSESIHRLAPRRRAGWSVTGWTLDKRSRALDRKLLRKRHVARGEDCDQGDPATARSARCECARLEASHQRRTNGMRTNASGTLTARA